MAELNYWQRLKGAIDSRIAEEQARQRAAQGSPSRSSSAGRRGGSRAVSPSKRQGRAREKRDGGQPGKSPDPSEFEPEFVIGDDDTASGAATPLREPEKTEEAVSGEDGNEKPLAAEEGETKPTPLEDSPMQTSTELPTEVRVKLRKLDKLESRYQGRYAYLNLTTSINCGQTSSKLTRLHMLESCQSNHSRPHFERILP